MSTMKRQVPKIGTIVRPVGSEIRYQVIDAHEYGCRVEAIDTEVVVADGRKARPLHYSEKRFSLAVSRDNGALFDDRWRAWEVL